MVQYTTLIEYRGEMRDADEPTSISLLYEASQHSLPYFIQPILMGQ
jgi:hypothetical protein